MRRLALTLLLLLAVGEVRAAEQIGRLFFTLDQRVQMDTARAQRNRATLSAEIEQEAAPAPEIFTYHGVVRRSDGKNTVWINDRAINDGKESGRLPPARPRPDGSIVIELPQSDRKVNLKVGQSVELRSGTVAEPYSRMQVPPKPAGKPAPEATASKPASSDASKAAPDSEKDQRTPDEAVRAPQNAAAKPTAASAPPPQEQTR
ncbi:MAG: hypothetical protein OEZ08_05065 [Betaproteobacteria bacterium]|nr:hypothetical protein [Betaproteobacteria bacterium]